MRPVVIASGSPSSSLDKAQAAQPCVHLALRGDGLNWNNVDHGALGIVMAVISRTNVQAIQL